MWQTGLPAAALRFGRERSTSEFPEPGAERLSCDSLAVALTGLASKRASRAAVRRRRQRGFPGRFLRAGQISPSREESRPNPVPTIVAGMRLAYTRFMGQRRQSATRVRSAAAGSWLALLAATTLGDGVDTLRAEVRANGLSRGAFRLVVQSYAGNEGREPSRWQHPIGSAQRAVTAEDLRAGVQVSLLELRETVPVASVAHPFVVAWIEAGEPDLEFDGRMARPGPGSTYGVARRSERQDAVHISLNRTVVA